MFRLNKRGGLTTDREALHASPGYKRQIVALAKLYERGDEMSAMTLERVRDWHRKRAKDLVKYSADPVTNRAANLHRKNADAIDAHLITHAQTVEKVREVVETMKVGRAYHAKHGAGDYYTAWIDKLAAAIGDK